MDSSRRCTIWRRIRLSSSASPVCWGRIWWHGRATLWLKATGRLPRSPGTRILPSGRWNRRSIFPPGSLLTKVTVENSCVQIIPGSHRRSIPHIPGRKRVWHFQDMADPQFFDVKQAINMELLPGRILPLFSERLLHRSSKNSFGQAASGHFRAGDLADRAYIPGQSAFASGAHGYIGQGQRCDGIQSIRRPASGM